MDNLYNLALTENGKGILFTKLSPIHGYGLFTDADIPANTILCRRLGLRSDLSQRDKRAIIGIDGLDAANAEDVIFTSINHSCDANVSFTNTGCIVNLKNLMAGDEITIDYSTLLHGSNWQANCLCGSLYCRHVIKSNE